MSQELTIKIYPPLPIVVGKVMVLGERPNSDCGLSFRPSGGRTIADALNFFRRSYKTFIKIERTQELTTKVYLPLPIVIGEAVVWGGRQNSVCRLSFCHSHGRTIADDSKMF